VTLTWLFLKLQYSGVMYNGRMGKILIFTGLFLLALGLLVNFLPGNGLPRLPGDIYIRKENFTFYLPLGWSLLLGLVISLGFLLLSK